MQLTNIVVTHQSRCFGALVEGAGKYFAIKFDTGASRTLISIELITGILTDNQMDAVRDLFRNKNISPVPCTSASGHEFSAYPAFMDNARIGGCEFEKFYYYLVAERLQKTGKSPYSAMISLTAVAFLKSLMVIF